VPGCVTRHSGPVIHQSLNWLHRLTVAVVNVDHPALWVVPIPLLVQGESPMLIVVEECHTGCGDDDG